MRLWALVLSPLLVYGSAGAGRAHSRIYGTYSNLSRSRQSGDLNGYELTLVAQPGSAYAVFECAQGAPSKTKFVPVRLTGTRISFTVNDADNACNGEYTGVFGAGGARLHSMVVGDTQLVPRRMSFWVTSATAR